MLTFEELLALWNDETTRPAMTVEQLDALAAHFAERAVALAEAAPSDEVLAELTEIRDNVAAVRSASTAATEAAERAEAEAAALLAEIRGETGEPEGEPAEPAEPAEPEEPAEPAEPEVEETTTEPTIEATDVVEPIAASAAPTFTRRLSPVAVRRPASTRPAEQTAGGLSLVASANLGGNLAAGTVIEDRVALGEAFMATFDHTEGYQGPPTSISVARGGAVGGRSVQDLYGPERYLSRDPIVNEQRIAATQDRDTIVAAGGRCVHSDVLYDLPIIRSTAARPVRDQMLTRFGADRGGVITTPPPILTELDGSVTVWTEANDQNPTSPTTKNCLELTCPDTDETVVAAIVSCLTVGNFRARFNPEQVAAWVDLAAVNHARQAETRLLTTIGTGSTQVTTGTILGTTRDVLTSLARIIAAAESRNRTDDGTPWTFGAPRWLRDQMRVDIIRQMPVGDVNETLAIADAKIDAMFAAQGINPVWLLDGETGQVFGPQGDGPLTGWPSTVITYLYPTGSWLFLDGGMIDFGLGRDNTSNRVNKFNIMSETFEGAHFHGVESFRITMDVCPDGSASALVDINPCSVGS